MRFPLALLAVAAAAIAVAAPAGANAPVQIRIQHQIHGCHAWSVANGAYYPAQTVRVHAGTSFVVTDNDVMPHTLVQLSGPRVVLHAPRMGHMGAKTELTLLKPGTYRFTTKPGEDYPGMAGMKTIGEDNVLRLMVVVA